MSDSEGTLPDRRSFLVRSAATLAAGPLLAAEACSKPPEDPAAQLADFVALSSALLGIDALKLAADPAPGGVKSEILALARGHDERLFATLLQTYRDRAHEGAASAASAVLTGAGAEVGFLAKSIMLAWLLGSWYDPAALRTAAQTSAGFVASSVISADAYRESWAWKIGQTKPMGTTTAGFGYWASPPAPMHEFLGGG